MEQQIHSEDQTKLSDIAKKIDELIEIERLHLTATQDVRIMIIRLLRRLEA